MQRETAAAYPFSKEFPMKDFAITDRHAFVRTLNLIACSRRDRHDTALCIACGTILASMIVGYLWRAYA